MHPSLTRPIQLRLLGEFDVAVHDISHTRAISYAKPGLLLAILAVAQGKPIARTELAQMLWPASQQDSRANLRHALYVLRRLFAAVPEVWLPGRHTLALNPDVIMVDVLALTGGYSGLGHAERLAYHRGELLEYMEQPHSATFSAWHNKWQLRIERDIAECREGLIAELAARGGLADAIEHAKNWVLHRPDDETAHRHLIRLLRDSGNDEAAMLALDHCRRMLHEHRNAEPAGQTLALLDRAHAAAPAADAPEAAARSAPYLAMPTRQYRPLAVLGVALTMDAPDTGHDASLEGLRTASERVRAKAETMGGHVKTGLDGSLLVLFGFPAVTEKPAHLCASLACELRDTMLPEGVRIGLGMHADVVMMHTPDPSQLVPALSHHAMRLAYLAGPGEILITAAARDRIITQFTLHYETRHGHAQHVLDAPRDLRPVGRMFGRMREFDTLVRMWARLPRAQAPGCMMVRGGPGIGKSLLVNVMAEYVRRTGGDVRSLACQEGHEHKPLHPVLSHLPAQPLRDGRDDTIEYLVTALLQRSSPDTALLIVWEDLHWADPSSIDLIRALLKRHQTAPTLVLLSAREEFEFDADANELGLRPLDRRSMAELVMHRSRGQRLTAAQRDQIVQHAGGIPLFAEEIVRQAALGVEVGAAPVILDLIAARMTTLASSAQQLAQFAAVTDELDDTLLARAAEYLGMTTRQAMAALSELHQHGLLEDGMPIRFRHALTRLAVYETIDPLDRGQLHAKAGQLMIEREPGAARAQAASIARHLDAAEHSDACRWWCIAGRDALAQSAASEAKAMADRALAALERIQDERARRKAELECQLLRGAVLTLLEGGGATETSEAYERVAQLHRHDDDPDMQFQMQWGEWVVAFNTQPHSRALRMAENLLQHAERYDSEIVLGSAQYAIGQTRLFMGDVARAERRLRTALHILGKRAATSRDLSAWGLERADSARGMLAWVLALQGRDDEGIDIAREGLHGADQPGQLSSRVLCQAVLCELHRLRGDVDETLAAASALKNITEHADLAFWRALADGMTGWVAAGRGDHRGVQVMEHAIRVAGRAMPIWQAPLELLMADSHSALSQPRAALECIERAGALIEHYGTQLIRGAYLYQKGMAQATAGEPDLAAASWRHAIVESRRLGLSLYARRAEARLNADNRGAAHAPR